MIVLDTDHLGALQYPNSNAANRLVARLESADDALATTIISVEEQMRGWLAAIHGQADLHQQVPAYERLGRLFEFYAQWEILPWAAGCADAFVRLRHEGVRIGTMELKIASNTLDAKAMLLSRNLRDFRLIPALRVEDWLS